MVSPSRARPLTTMCLAIPGQIVEIQGGDDPMQRTGRVKFGGIVKEVNLAYTPQATVDDYVLVHVGFSLSIVDEDEAKKVFEYLDEMQELDELDERKELEEAGSRGEPPAG